MSARNVSIGLTGNGDGAVSIDGEEIPGVRSLHVASTAGERPRLVLDVLMHEVEVDGEMAVYLPEPTRDALAALGWATPEQITGAYRERARLVAHLAAAYPDGAVLAFSDPDTPGWAVLTIETPAGQMSWHISPDDLDLFPENLAARVHAEDPRAKWDGHDTPTKYERLTELTARTHYEHRAAQART